MLLYYGFQSELANNVLWPLKLKFFLLSVFTSSLVIKLLKIQ